MEDTNPLLTHYLHLKEKGDHVGAVGIREQMLEAGMDDPEPKKKEKAK